MITRRDFLAAAAGAATGAASTAVRTERRADAPADILVMHRRDEQDRFARPCDADRCAVVDMSVEQPLRLTAAIVVVTGHSAPPFHVLGREPDEVMTAVARACRYGLVIDTCYGMSDAVLKPLVAAGFRGHVVGPLRKLPARGLVYGPAFFNRAAPVAERLAAVQDPAGVPLVRWTANERDLDDALRQVERLNLDELDRGLERRHPHLFLSRLGPAADVLIHVPVERFAGEDAASLVRSSPT